MQVPTEDWLVDRKEDDLQLATVQKWFQGAHTPHKRYWKRLRHYIARANKRNSSG